MTAEGAPQAVIAKVMGHSIKTNRKHYRAACEPLIVLRLKLHHPHDPPMGSEGKSGQAARRAKAS